MRVCAGPWRVPMGMGGGLVDRPYAAGGITPPPLDPNRLTEPTTKALCQPPPPLPMFEADSQHFASAP